MIKRIRRLLMMPAILAIAAFTAGATAQPEKADIESTPTEIIWWHAMGGRLGEKVEEIAAGFNASQATYNLTPVLKGSYAETMTAAIAAFRSGEQPHIVQVYEVGTASMMAAKGAIKPVYEVMALGNKKFDESAYLGPVRDYYVTPDGRMLSMPFNSSTPVFYYNKDAFVKAGLDPDKPPKTWPEVEEYARKLVQSGAVKYGLSTSWPSWIQIENFSAWHNVPLATKGNGFEGLDTELTINTPLHIRHIETLARWEKEGVFSYGGRGSTANAKFSSGEVGMYTESSAGYAGISGAAQFEFGVSTLPYWPDVPGAPQNSIIGGATLWVMSGHDDAEYRAVAAFFDYLSSAEIQADWHQFTGYLPITHAAHQLSQSQGFYSKTPDLELAINQITLNPANRDTRGLRLGNFVQVRSVIEDEMEAAFAGTKTAKQAMEDAVRRGNELLRQFEQANR